MAIRTVGAMAERLADMPDEAAECRVLRHAWPRKSHPDYQELTHTEVTSRDRQGRVTRIERTMRCTGGCGVVRVMFLAIDPRTGQAWREHRPLYRYPPNYRIRADGKLDRRALEYALLARLYPDLQW